MRKSRVIATVLVFASSVSPVMAEIVVPNPLIKPPQITPIAAAPGSPGSPPGQATGPEAAVPGAMPLPRLPGLASQRDSGSSSGRNYAREGDSPDAGTRKGRADGEALRNALGRYKVVFVSSDQAVMRVNANAPVQAQSGQDGQGMQSGSTKDRSGSAFDSFGPPQMTVRDKGIVKFGGELLKVRIDGDTVELYRAKDVTKGQDEEETVFFESLAPSTTPAYVPDQNRLEKPDTRYQNSIRPEPSKVSLGSSMTPNQGPSQSPLQ